jgi:hypothetical protein
MMLRVAKNSDVAAGPSYTLLTRPQKQVFGGCISSSGVGRLRWVLVLNMNSGDMVYPPWRTLRCRMFFTLDILQGPQ